MGNSPVPGEFPTQRASNAENVSIWWRHHEQKGQDSGWRQGQHCLLHMWGWKKHHNLNNYSYVTLSAMTTQNIGNHLNNLFRLLKHSHKLWINTPFGRESTVNGGFPLANCHKSGKQFHVMPILCLTHTYHMIGRQLPSNSLFIIYNKITRTHPTMTIPSLHKEILVKQALIIEFYYVN